VDRTENEIMGAYLHKDLITKEQGCFVCVFLTFPILSKFREALKVLFCIEMTHDNASVQVSASFSI
jgi:hypothetical protein